MDWSQHHESERSTTMNRYTPIPPIAPSDADSDGEKTDDDDEEEGAELDEEFQLDDKQYEDVRQEMKKRMFELSELDAFDNLVRKLSLPLQCLSYRTITTVKLQDS